MYSNGTEPVLIKIPHLVTLAHTNIALTHPKFNLQKIIIIRDAPDIRPDNPAFFDIRYRKPPKFGHILKFGDFFLHEIIFFRTCFTVSKSPMALSTSGLNHQI
jgi:hypothetical protein